MLQELWKRRFEKMYLGGAGRTIKREGEARILRYDVGQFGAGYVDMRRIDWKG